MTRLQQAANVFLIVALLLAAACRTGASVGTPSSLFPQASLDPFTDQWYSKQLRAAHEPALRPTASQDLEFFRFSIIPSFAPTVTMRVSRLGGEYRLTAKRLTGAGGYDPGKVGVQRDRLLSSAQAALLDGWIAQMDFWAMATKEPPPQEPPGVVVVYLDGTVWLLEAADATRYHVVERSHSKRTTHPAFEQMWQCLHLWSFGPSAALEMAAECGPQLSSPQQTGRPQFAVTETGVGPITKSTPATLARIAELFPQFKVIPGVVYGEGVASPTVRVMDGRTEILYVLVSQFPGSEGIVANVATKSDRVVYGGKTKVGSVFSEVFGTSIPADCEMGLEEDFEKVVCDAAPKSHIRLLFSGRNDRRDGGMPSPSALAKWRITKMWWYP